VREEGTSIADGGQTEPPSFVQEEKFNAIVHRSRHSSSRLLPRPPFRIIRRRWRSRLADTRLPEEWEPKLPVHGSRFAVPNFFFRIRGDSHGVRGMDSTPFNKTRKSTAPPFKPQSLLASSLSTQIASFATTLIVALKGTFPPHPSPPLFVRLLQNVLFRYLECI